MDIGNLNEYRKRFWFALAAKETELPQAATILCEQNGI